MHPALLDATLHVAAVLGGPQMPGLRTSIRVPASLAALTIAPPGDCQCLWPSAMPSAPQSGGLLSCDYQVMADGCSDAAQASMAGVLTKELQVRSPVKPTGLAAANAASAHRGLLYEVQWQAWASLMNVYVENKQPHFLYDVGLDAGRSQVHAHRSTCALRARVGRTYAHNLPKEVASVDMTICLGSGADQPPANAAIIILRAVQLWQRHMASLSSGGINLLTKAVVDPGPQPAGTPRASTAAAAAGIWAVARVAALEVPATPISGISVAATFAGEHTSIEAPPGSGAFGVTAADGAVYISRLGQSVSTAIGPPCDHHLVPCPAWRPCWSQDGIHVESKSESR